MTDEQEWKEYKPYYRRGNVNCPKCDNKMKEKFINLRPWYVCPKCNYRRSKYKQDGRYQES